MTLVGLDAERGPSRNLTVKETGRTPGLESLRARDASVCKAFSGTLGRPLPPAGGGDWVGLGCWGRWRRSYPARQLPASGQIATSSPEDPGWVLQWNGQARQPAEHGSTWVRKVGEDALQKSLNLELGSDKGWVRGLQGLAINKGWGECSKSGDWVVHQLAGQ